MHFGGASKLKKKSKYMILLLLLLFVGVLIFPILCDDGSIPNPLSLLIPDQDAEEWDGSQELPQAGKNEEVIVPGFDSLVCYADQTKQKVNFYNPVENSCLMRMTLYADSQKIWSNDGYLEPGKGYYEIDFSEPPVITRFCNVMQLTPFIDLHSLWTVLTVSDQISPFTQTGLLCN